MDTAAVAKLLALNVNADWDVIAEIETPGVAAKLAAVRAGNTSTRTLPVAYAARLATELGATVCIGDTRNAVAAAVAAATPLEDTPDVSIGESDVARPSRRDPQRVSAAATKLFAGDAETISARLAARRGRINADHIAGWAVRDTSVRDATLFDVLANSDREGVAAALAVTAVEHRDRTAEVIGDYEAWLRARHAAPGHGNACVAALRTLTAGIRAALARWLTDHHHDGYWSTDSTNYGGTRSEPCATTITFEAGEGLASAAAWTGQYFQGPQTLAEVALAVVARHHDALNAPAYNWSHVVATAAASGLRWSHTRRTLFGAPSQALEGALVSSCAFAALETAAGTGPATTFAAEVLATEARIGDARTNPIVRLDTLLGHTVEHLTCTETLAVCAAFSGPRTARWSTDTLWSQPALAYLAGAYGNVTAAELAAAENDAALAGYLDALAAVSISAAAPRAGTAAAALWRRAINTRAVAELLAVAATNKALGGEWARLCEEHIEALGLPERSKAELWTAVCVLAPTFAGTTTELIEVAANTIT